MMSAHLNLSTELDQADNLRKSYDQDINTLRKMLQDARHYDSTSHNNSSSDYTKLSLENCNISSPSSRFNILNSSHNSTQQTGKVCNECGDNVQKMKCERDELLRRFRQGEASRTTIEERQELERQLHKAKNDLFRHKKKAREQLEDIEEQLEHAQNVFDEKMLEKDSAIESLSQEINELKLSASVVVRPATGETCCQTEGENFQNSISIDDLKTLDMELKRMETKCIKSEKLAEVCENKLQEEIDKLKSKYKSSEKLGKELKRNCEEAEKTIKSMRNTLEENERNISKFQDLLTREKENTIAIKDKYEEELNSLKKAYEADKAKYKKLKGSVDSKQKKIAVKYESTIKDFHSQVSQLQLKLDEMNHLKSKFDEERDWLKQSQKLNEDYLIEQNSKLENKLSFVQKELAESLEKNSRLENSLYEKDTEHIEKLHELERKLNLEIDNLKEKLRNTENDFKSMASKSKESNSISQHRDQRLASSIQEECHKLSILCESINPATRYNSSGMSVKKASSLSCKKSLVDLQDAVELVCRGTNDLLCEVTRLRRESKLHKESAFKSQQRCDDSTPSFKQHLTSSSKQLKSSRERFGSYDTLLRSYDFDRSSPMKTDNAWKKDRMVKDDTNTVKLLTRLQGRVKQLRTDNALSKSTFHLSQTP